MEVAQDRAVKDATQLAAMVVGLTGAIGARPPADLYARGRHVAQQVAESQEGDETVLALLDRNLPPLP